MVISGDGPTCRPITLQQRAARRRWVERQMDWQIMGVSTSMWKGSLFIDYLFQFPSVWTDGSGNTFCEWIDNNLWSTPAYMPTTWVPASTQIGRCYPSLANSRSIGIPVLEQRANEYKQSSFYVTEQILDPAVLTTAPGIVNSGTFRGLCPSSQIGVLRSLAMITPFMNSLPARNAFIQTNNCIRGVYTTWYTAYAANAPPNTVPSAATFIQEYDAWVKSIVSGIQGAVTSQMSTLLPLYNGGDDTAVNVKLSTNAVISAWSKLNPPVPAGTGWTPTNNLNTGIGSALISVTSVGTADLRTLAANVPQINWLNSLP
ncbi:hypothetical protein GGX14DRAFT_185147 [Mycena pura]|uniref:Uncharacterized protein n=1 Tax=Mycena pura TaxID=153505 RepID=A0AAD6Y2I8_9AGAR|nr:hypothetical protein GGX14DRAFT_185147 [Mycena pura]